MSIYAKRNKLLKHFTEKGYSYSVILEIVKPMKGMKDEEKEALSGAILEIIRDCLTEGDALAALQEAGML